MPGTGGQHRKTEARFIQVKAPPLPKFRDSPVGEGGKKRATLSGPWKGITKQGFNAALFYEPNR